MGDRNPPRTGKTGRGDGGNEIVGAAFQQLVQSLGQMQQAMNLQGQEMMQKMLDALRIQDIQVRDSVRLLEKTVQETACLQDQRLSSIEASISALKTERAGEDVIRKNAVQTLEVRVQKLEEKVQEVAQRPPLIVGRERRRFTGDPDTLEQHGDRVEKLNGSIQETLNSLSGRVEALELQLQGKDPPVEFPSVLITSHVSSSSSKKISSLDVGFENLVKFSDNSVSSCVGASTSADLHSSHVSPTRVPFASSPLHSNSSSTPSERVPILGDHLFLAVKCGMEEEVLKLLDSHAIDVNFSDEKKNTALHEAVCAGHTNIVSLLLDRGVNVNARNNNEETALHFAVQSVKTDLVSLVVKRGCDVNIRNCEGTTALHVAACVDHTGHCINILIQAGAHINLKNARGATPLHLASSASNIGAVRLLLRMGAARHVRNNFGKTPYDLAETGAIRYLLHPQSQSKKKQFS